MSPRNDPPPASDDEPDSSIAYFRSHKSEIERRSHRWARVIAPSIVVLILTGAAVLLLLSTVAAHGDSAQSGRTQHHGQRVEGTVTQVSNTSHSYLRGSRFQLWTTWYRARINVTLSAPVDGDARTTAYSPQPSSLQPGSSITVLLDPSDHAYAELPGEPLEGRSGWIWLALLSILMFAVDIVLVTAWSRALRRKRQPGNRNSTPSA